MKQLFVILFIAGTAFAQGVRFDSQVIRPENSVSQFLIYESAPAVSICTAPANSVPCTNKATTYTDATLGTSCSSATQIVLAGTSTCVGGTDSYGNWGVWVAAGNYEYTITFSDGSSEGPFPFTAGSESVSTHNLLSATHPDTTPATVLRGAMVVGVDTEGVVKWTLFPKGTANQIWAMDGTATDPGWRDRLEPVDVGVTFNSTPTTNMPLVRHPFPFAVSIPANCTHSKLVAATAATGSATFTLSKCTSVSSCSSFGSAAFSASGQVATFTCTATNFAEGDILLLTSPGTPDGTLAGLGGTIYGTRAGGTQ